MHTIGLYNSDGNEEGAKALFAAIGRAGHEIVPTRKAGEQQRTLGPGTKWQPPAKMSLDDLCDEFEHNPLLEVLLVIEGRTVASTLRWSCTIAVRTDCGCTVSRSNSYPTQDAFAAGVVEHDLPNALRVLGRKVARRPVSMFGKDRIRADVT
jgi:hypothetical protein